MDLLSNLALGLGVAFTFQNLFYCFVGVLLGTLIGVLPGIGPAAGTAILIPLTFQLDATGAIIMLAAIYYGAMYVSYGLGVGACLGLFLLLRGFFPMMPLYWVIAALAGFMILSGPYLYALSKSIWANLFIPYSGKPR